MSTKQYRQSKYMVVEGFISTLVNVLLFIFKYIVGISTGSVAIIADAWHTLSDCVSSIIVIIGGFYSKKPADKEHPFGHGRIEIILNIIIGIILISIAYSFLREGIEKIISRTHTTFDNMSIAIMIISIVAKEALAQFSFWAGRKVNAMSLVSDGWHHRTDALSSIVILFGIWLNKYFFWADGALAIVVSSIILITALRIIFGAIHTIIGEVPNKELLASIMDIANSVDNINSESMHHFHIHRYGSHIEMTFHIRFAPQTTVFNAHEAVNELEHKLKDTLNIESTIHIESIK